MKSIPRLVRPLIVLGLLLAALGAEAQSFRVQCPPSTNQHPNGVNGADGSTIKCQQIAGGDGYATMADGHTIYLFGFGPLSGLNSIYTGQPGTEPFGTFNTTYGANNTSGSTGTPGTLIGMPDSAFTFNGAIGLTSDYSLDPWTAGTAYAQGIAVRTPPGAAIEGVFTATLSGVSGVTVPTITATTKVGDTFNDGGIVWTYSGSLLDGHVDPRPIMDVGVMNANQPAPLIAIDEDDELFLTLTNVGMIMRPDLFEQHTVHFHGYPNASAFYDGVPDASIAINIGGSFSYYYLAPDAGTYFWHCHIAPPEHLQMGMVGQLFVRARQNRLAVGSGLWTALRQWDLAPAPNPAVSPTPAVGWAAYEPIRKRCGGDILCSTPVPATDSGATRAAAGGYAYNDGDGSTYFDVEYPIQIHGFDPNFHFVGMTFNPESFNDMKDKYFLLNGRSYPDTVGGYICGDPNDPARASPDPWPACNGQSAGTVVPGPMRTQSTDGTYHASQPLASVINIPVNGKALLRISDLSVSEYATLATLGVPMKVVGLNARLLRDLAGNNMAYWTNSITLAGGESIDVILDATGLAPGQKFFLYTPNLDHLSNDAENFGGMMTEVNVCPQTTPYVDTHTKACTATAPTLSPDQI